MNNPESKPWYHKWYTKELASTLFAIMSMVAVSFVNFLVLYVLLIYSVLQAVGIHLTPVNVLSTMILWVWLLDTLDRRKNKYP